MQGKRSKSIYGEVKKDWFFEEFLVKFFCLFSLWQWGRRSFIDLLRG
jgi:hypothetical protein